MPFRAWLSQLLGIALGVLLGVLLSLSLFEERLEHMLDERLEAQLVRMRASAGPQVVVSPPVAAAPVADNREELRALREQLAVLIARSERADTSSGSGEAEAQKPEPPKAPTAAQEEAARQAQQLLDSALARGRWSDEDDLQFMRASQAASPERTEELALSLSQAINSGRLRPALVGGGER